MVNKFTAIPDDKKDEKIIETISIEAAIEPIFEHNKKSTIYFYKTEKGYFTDDSYFKALELSGGNISRAANILGVTRDNFYQRARKNPDFKKTMVMIRERKIDFVEDKLWEHIVDGNPNAIMFYLRTVGKGRGYNTQVEVIGDSDKPVNININVGNQLNEGELS